MTDDYVRRTAITRLSVNSEQRDALEATITDWKRGYQIATNLAWGSATRRVTYNPSPTIRCARIPTSVANTRFSPHQAAQAITGCIVRRAKGQKASKPEFTAPTVKYDTRTMTLFDDETVSLTTTENRIRVGLVLPEDPDGYQRQYLDADKWEPTERAASRRVGRATVSSP